MAAASSHTDQSEWAHLTTGKEFSRLLYPNPVCFLSSASPDEDADGRNAGARKGAAARTTPDVSGARRNVMILSWLAPTNNRGRFMFSLHKGRYTASLLAPYEADEGKGTKRWRAGIEFALSVPVKGMEQLVLDVGSVSGKFGSKFPPVQGVGGTSRETDDAAETAQMSNRQRKKMRRERLAREGVRGLVPVHLGSSLPLQADIQTSPSLFAIEGTVAHMKCRTYAVSGTLPASDEPKIQVNEDSNMKSSEGREDDFCNESPPIIDEEHLLVMAEVIDAYVQESYWDGEKLLFRPLSRDVPPFLTFFGSQTFGHVQQEMHR
ncbi:hypothetical protein ACHAXT_012302 [Thalassiosira profunda]